MSILSHCKWHVAFGYYISEPTHLCDIEDNLSQILINCNAGETQSVSLTVPSSATQADNPSSIKKLSCQQSPLRFYVSVSWSAFCLADYPGVPVHNGVGRGM